MLGDPERLDEGRQDVKPRAVVPKRLFDILEHRAVVKAARVPGQRFLPVIVSVPFVDGDAVIPDGCEPDDGRAAEHRYRDQDLRIKMAASPHELHAHTSNFLRQPRPYPLIEADVPQKNPAVSGGV